MISGLQIPGAELYYDPTFLNREESSRYVEVLLERCDWKRHKTSFGPPVPRDEAYYGDSGTHYTYSRREYLPLAWLPELLALKSRVEQATPSQAYSNSG